ncbi:MULTISPECIES: MarR family transcriptional regulator [unclassified Novosphingobium]|uniref:MarR family transcriptional regulator n=1 Tax=unclassified Novosphingobium TaxID=2644732 RepID=UPI001358D2D4|nr:MULTISPECIES: MarR family transcriptional regulator [unclassified Novosphingobium]
MRDMDFIQPDFAYGAAPGAARSGAGDVPVRLSIYADRPHLRATMREDAGAAGLTVAAAGALADLTEDAGRSLGDIVLVDCPQVDAASLAALARLDMRAGQGGPRLIVSTSVDALEDVFACMDQSSPVLLVDPDRAERVIALGQVLASFPSGRLRELSEDDRLMLLRLTEQVGQIAGRIDRLDPRGSAAAVGNAVAERPSPPGAAPRAKAQLPDAKLVRRIIRQRQLRARFFDGDLFADPAWDMLLDLTASRIENKQVSVTSLCIAAAVPPTTALRWIGQMVEAGLFARVSDAGDRRRAFIELSDKAVAAMAGYFAEIVMTAPVPV